MMVKPKTEKRKRARELRRQGWSYSEIVKELRCAKSSVSNWCKDIDLLPEQEERLEKRRYEGGRKGRENSNIAEINREAALEQRRKYQEVGRKKAREGCFLHVVGCMLYWAEGAKSTRNAIHFANSDEVMMELFIRFLREELAVEDEKIKVQVHCHTNDADEIQRIEDYWLDLLNLPRDVLYKTQIVESASKTRNRLENGVCSVRVNNTEHLMHIFGAIQEYGNFTNEEWLL